MVVDGWLHDKIAPCRLKKTDRNPTDRGKLGRKMETDDRCERVTSLTGCLRVNTHDIKLVEDTLDVLQTGRPGHRPPLSWTKAMKPNDW